MAWNVGITWQLDNSIGASTNGGGYDPTYGGANGGTDMSLGSPTALSGLSTSGAGATTVSGTGFTTSMNGNVFYCTGGTNFVAGYYLLTGIVAGVSAVFSSSPTPSAAGSAGTGNVGGPLDSWGTLGAAIFAAAVPFKAYVKITGSTYGATLTTANTSGGVISLPTINPNLGCESAIIGYQTNRTPFNTDGMAPIQAQVASATLYSFSTLSGLRLRNLVLDGNSQTSSQAINGTSGIIRIDNCVFKNFTNGVATGAGAVFVMSDCEIFGCTTATVLNGSKYHCERCNFHNNTSSKIFSGSSPLYCVDCKFTNNGNASTDVILLNNGNWTVFLRCIFHGSGRHVFNNSQALSNNMLVRIEDCIFTNNAGYAVTGTNLIDTLHVINCAFYGNQLGDVDATKINAATVIGKITLPGLPYNNPTADDYGLNSGAGNLCRNAGLPTGTLINSNTMSAQDLGCSHHADPRKVRGRLGDGS